MANPVRAYKQAPANRIALLILGLSILAGLAVAVPGAQIIFVAGISILVILFGLDGALLFAARPELEIAGPDKPIRLHRMRSGKFAFAVRLRKTGRARIESLSIALPDSFDEQVLTFPLALPTDSESLALEAHIVPLRRGTLQAEGVSYAGSSLFGLWQFRIDAEIDWTFHVFPDLPAEEPRIAAFLINRDFTGMTTRRIHGLGRDFDRLREYQPGDPYSSISWKASARRNDPITIVRQLERTQQVYCLMDTSRFSQRVVDQVESPSKERHRPLLALDRYINGALSLAMAANNQGDCFGAIAFSRFPSLFMKARAGQAHFLALQNKLRDLSPDRGQPNYDELFTQVGSKIRSRALLVVFTQFDNAHLLDSFLRAARIVSRQHVVLAISILPDDAKELFQGEEAGDDDAVYRHMAGHLTWKRIAQSKKRLSQAGIHFALASQENLCAEVVSRYLTIKERQLV